MIEVKLNEILEKHERSLNWVSKKTNIAYSTLNRLIHNNTTGIKFETLDALCTLFDCNTEDIIKHIKEKK